MTTVAYRDGIIAADTGMVIGDTRIGFTRKIARSPHGAIGGGAGSAGFVESFLRWIDNGAKDGDAPEPRTDNDYIDRGILIKPGAQHIVHVFEPGGWCTVECAYYALGDGREVALGCFFKNGGAIEAVEAAMLHTSFTFGKIEHLLLGDGRSLTSELATKGII